MPEFTSIHLSPFTWTNAHTHMFPSTFLYTCFLQHGRNMHTQELESCLCPISPGSLKNFLSRERIHKKANTAFFLGNSSAFLFAFRLFLLVFSLGYSKLFDKERKKKEKEKKRKKNTATKVILEFMYIYISAQICSFILTTVD